MRYAGIIRNDFSSAPGVCLTVFVQGCPNRCPGCHNPETWDFDGGLEFTQETMDSIIRDLNANGVKRNLCIMGGEPMCKENIGLTARIINEVVCADPNIKIYVWTGFKFEDLVQQTEFDFQYVLGNTDVLIDGKYEQDKRDVRLFMRGSSNQRIIDLSHGDPHIREDLMKGNGNDQD